MSTDFLIKLSHIGLTIEQQVILNHVDLELCPGKILTVIGPNGAGKTSLLKLILGVYKPTSGKLELAGNLKIGYMPQRLQIDGSLPLTVERFLTLSERSSKKGALEKLELVGALSIRKSPIQAISGGELQRVLLARALLRSPNLLVLDEPAQGVDLHGQQSLYHLLGDIRDQTGCGILLVSHDLHFVMAATDQVVCINQHVCCSGTADAVSNHPEYLALFDRKLGRKAATDIAIYTHHHDHHHDLHGDVVCQGHPPSGTEPSTASPQIAEHARNSDA